MAASEEGVVTVHHMAKSLGLPRRQTTRIAWKFEKKLGLARLPGRSPAGHLVTAYSKVDAERIVAAQRHAEKRRRENALKRVERASQIEWDTGTAKRHDVMSIFEFAETLGVSRQYAGRVATRYEKELGIERIPARSESGRAIVAYHRVDGERMVEAFKANPAARLRPSADSAGEVAARPKQEMFYLVDLSAAPELFSIGWTGDITAKEAALQAASTQAEVVRTWPCAEDLQAAAMNRVFTSKNVEIASGEEIRSQDVESLIAGLDEFFSADPG